MAEPLMWLSAILEERLTFVFALELWVWLYNESLLPATVLASVTRS